MTDAEIVLDRLYMSCEFVLPEIVATTRVHLLEHGWDYDRVSEIATCEHYLRSKLAAGGDPMRALLSRLDVGSIQRGFIRLVMQDGEKTKEVICHPMDELLDVAPTDWDET